MITVCMATYNGGKYIRQQIDSILPQLKTDDELVISDDGSCDNTIEIISSYSDPRIKLFRFLRDKSGMPPVELVTTNFENALLHASGDIIFLSDQDDVWTPDKVEVISAYLAEYDYVVHDCYVTDSQLNVKAYSRFDGSVSLNRWKALFKPTPYQGCCTAFTRKVLSIALPFPSGIQSHDRWIGFVASFSCKYRIVPERLIYYRRHENNTSTATEASTSPITTKIANRMKYIKELSKRLVINRLTGGGCSLTPYNCPPKRLLFIENYDLCLAAA